jgi:hypothetical protein
VVPPQLRRGYETARDAAWKAAEASRLALAEGARLRREVAMCEQDGQICIRRFASGRSTLADLVTELGAACARFKALEEEADR